MAQWLLYGVLGLLLLLGRATAEPLRTAQGKQHMHCSAADREGMNPLAFSSNKAVDFFSSSNAEATRAAHLASVPVFRAALAALTAPAPAPTAATEAVRAQQLAALDPAAAQCAFLQVAHVERAGLGHTLGE